ncbi:MAG: PH domain-containing protein [Bacillus sp. (in: Bacteria)]|nr:PH domain-containing protein [Bacillus sp. (in: firmicutes)]
MELEPQKRISKQALKVWKISAVILVVIGWLINAVAIFLVNSFEGPDWVWMILIVLGVIFTFLHIFLFPSLRWRQWRYEVREEEIEIAQGIFIRTRTLIPMIRVQHVDMVQGPLLRKYQLASVIINTAATKHEIPALDESEAEELRFFISKLARVADEDV